MTHLVDIREYLTNFAQDERGRTDKDDRAIEKSKVNVCSPVCKRLVQQDERKRERGSEAMAAESLCDG